MVTNSTVTSNPNIVRDGNSGSLTGVNVLLVIIYGGMVGLMCILFIKRLLLRIAPKYSKGYTDVVKHAPEALKEDIQKRLMQTINVYHEPLLLSPDDYRQQSLSSSDTTTQYGYLYRMKAVDAMRKLEDILEKQELERSSHKEWSHHLHDLKSHSSGILKNVRTSQIKSLMDMYEHARYKQERFGKVEYNKMIETLSEIMSGIEQKSRKRRSSKKQSSRKNTSSSNNSGAAKPGLDTKHGDKDPLIRN